MQRLTQSCSLSYISGLCLCCCSIARVDEVWADRERLLAGIKRLDSSAAKGGRIQTQTSIWV